MNIDQSKLGAFAVATTKLCLDQRGAIHFLRLKISQLEIRLETLAPRAEMADEALASVKTVDDALQESLDALDERTEALLSALEALANG